jgi:hypothetical protein
MDVVDRIFEHWKGQGVPLNSGASNQDLAAFQTFLGRTLPADVSRFYSAANGMEDFAHDSKMVSFWSIDRILREKDVALAGGEGRGSAFADVMIYSWTFRYLSRSAGPMSVMADGSQLEHDSLAAFLEQYLADPNSLGLVDAV